MKLILLLLLLLQVLESKPCHSDFLCYEEYKDQVWVISDKFDTAPCNIRCMLATCGVLDSCQKQLQHPVNFSKVVKQLQNITCKKFKTGQLYTVHEQLQRCTIPNVTSTQNCNARAAKMDLQTSYCICKSASNCDIPSRQAFPSIFPPFTAAVGGCDVNNGGCDPRTTCTEAAGNITCGPCPIGFQGSGSTGCSDINECLTSPCASGTTCTNNNLTSISNITATSCICNNGTCARGNGNVTGISGNYTCVNYTSINTSSYRADICSLYQNGNSNVVVIPSIYSTNPSCSNHFRWILYSLRNEILYRSQSITSYVSPSLLSYVYPNCVTLNNCSEVLNCGNDTMCKILNHTCYSTTTGQPILYDNGTNASACYQSQPVQLSRCLRVNNQECFIMNFAKNFTTNGQYLCSVNGPDGCVVFRNIHGDELRLIIEVANPAFCQDFFQFVATSNNGIVYIGNSSDGRTPLDQVVFNSSTLFDTCYQTYTCSPCDVGYKGSGYQSCTDINECAAPIRLFCENQACINLSPGYACGVCLPTYSQSPCAPNSSSSTLRITILNAITNTPYNATSSRVVFVETVTTRYVVNPANDVFGGLYATSTSQLKINFRDGNFTMFTVPLIQTLNGFGPIVMFPQRGQDLFYSGYYVPRSALTFASARVAVLSWQSQNVNTVFTDLNLNAQKYQQDTFGCTGTACCLANANNANNCSFVTTVSSQTSDFIESMRFFDYDRNGTTATARYFSYFFYVSAQNTNNLRYVNPQLNFFRQNVASPDNIPNLILTLSQAQQNNPSFLPTYWAVACLLIDPPTGSFVGYRYLSNNGSSILTNSIPSATLCA